MDILDGKDLFNDKQKKRYRFVVFKDDSFEEVVSLNLTKTGSFVLLSTVFVVMTVFIYLLIAFTPLKFYIPGFNNRGGDPKMRQEIIQVKFKVDSLEHAFNSSSSRMKNLRKVLSGNFDTTMYTQRGTLKASNFDTMDLTKLTKEDLILRKEVASMKDVAQSYQSGNLFDINKLLFLSPVKGFVSSEFNPGNGAFGIDILADPNEPVKATLDGTVIYSGWSLKNGNMIVLLHKNNLVSCYMHNSILLKPKGSFVKAGEAIGVVGNSGESKKGFKLHFEIWYNGTALNPKNYVKFN